MSTVALRITEVLGRALCSKTSLDVSTGRTNSLRDLETPVNIDVRAAAARLEISKKADPSGCKTTRRRAWWTSRRFAERFAFSQGAKLVLMRRRTAPKITTGVLVALSIIFSGCSPSERTAAGFWESRSVILRISREGKHGERYIVEWKEPGRRATGSFGGSLLDASLSRRDGRTMISEDPTVGDFAYSRLRDVLIWHGELFSRVTPEHYVRASPQ